MNAFILGLTYATIASSALIILLMLLRAVTGRHIPTRWRYALWLLALVCLLMPFRIPSPTSMLNAVEPFTKGIEQQMTSAQNTQSQPQSLQSAPASDIDVSPAQAPIPAAVAMPTKAPADILWRLWLAGASVCALYLLFINLRFMRYNRHAVADCRAQAICDELCQSLGIRRRIQVRISNTIPAPCMSFRRIFLTPETLLDEAMLRHVLLHELCHLRQHDLAIAWLRNAALVLHWFNPLVWLAARMAQNDAELSCDSLVLRCLSPEDAPKYGMTLLHLLPRKALKIRMLTASTLSIHPSGIKERIHMIVHQPPKRFVTAFATVLLAVLLAACTLTGAVAVVEEKLPELPALLNEPQTPSPLPAETKPSPSQTPATIAAPREPVPLENTYQKNYSPLTEHDKNGKKRYDAALKAYQQGERPERKAPADPFETDFAVVALNPGVYGTDAFAFLPMRPLTDEEMLQLVDGMGGMDKSGFTSTNSTVRRENECSTSNRSFTREERSRYGELERKYRYEGLRSKDGMATNDAQRHDIAVISLNPEYFGIYADLAVLADSISFQLLPNYVMTDDQLLSLLANRYRSFKDEDLKPTAGQLTYAQACAQSITLMARYLGISAMPDTQEASYATPTVFGSHDGKHETWVVLNYYNAHTDETLAGTVLVTMDANTGEPLSLMNAASFDPHASDKEKYRSKDPALQAAAEDYVLTHFIDGASDLTIAETIYKWSMRIATTNVVNGKNLGIPFSEYWITLSNGMRYAVYVSRMDMSVLGIRKDM